MDDHRASTPTRRGFLDWIIGLFSTIAGAAMVLPGVAYLWPAAKGGKSEDVEAKGTESLKPGESIMIQVHGKAVIVRKDASALAAYSAVCPHLGCLVKWDGGRKEFLCPCHAAVFDSSGRVISGPSPGPLPAYVVKEISGKVYVGPA